MTSGMVVGISCFLMDAVRMENRLFCGEHDLLEVALNLRDGAFEGKHLFSRGEALALGKDAGAERGEQDGDEPLHVRKISLPVCALLFIVCFLLDGMKEDVAPFAVSFEFCMKVILVLAFVMTEEAQRLRQIDNVALLAECKPGHKVGIGMVRRPDVEHLRLAVAAEEDGARFAEEVQRLLQELLPDGGTAEERWLIGETRGFLEVWQFVSLAIDDLAIRGHERRGRTLLIAGNHHLDFFWCDEIVIHEELEIFSVKVREQPGNIF